MMEHNPAQKKIMAKLPKNQKKPLLFAGLRIIL